MEETIEEGRGVILKKGKNLKYICISKHKQEKMENFFFSCESMIGHAFGTAFKVLDKKRLEKIDPVSVQDHAEEYETPEVQSQESVTEDNRLIQDNTKSQKLSKAEIMAYRKDGKPGEEIIEELIENSATFQERTEYSKAKYLKKKKKKYIAQFVVLKPSSRLLCEMYFTKCPQKTMELRPDSLAQLLTWSNVHASSNILLMETCQGLVTGAVMERLTKDGKLLQVYHGSSPVRIITEQFNFSVDDIDNLVCSFPLDKLKILKELLSSERTVDEIVEIVLGKIKVENFEGKNTANSSEINVHPVIDMTVEETDEGDRDDNRKRGSKRTSNGAVKEDKRNSNAQSRVAFLNRQQRIKECQLAIEYLRNKSFDSLIIASKFHPKNILINLLEYLQYGCPFVVYFTHQEPLMECQIILRELNIATHIESTESFLRNVQVLPNRTHPEIVMSATGGYILRGIKIDSSS